MFKSSKNNMKNWLHMHLPKVTKIALGPLEVNNLAPVELRGSPRLGIPIPPLNSRILNTYKQIFIQIEFILILDVW
jgi:hypothetical protein